MKLAKSVYIISRITHSMLQDLFALKIVWVATLQLGRLWVSNFPRRSSDFMLALNFSLVGRLWHLLGPTLRLGFNDRRGPSSAAVRSSDCGPSRHQFQFTTSSSRHTIGASASPLGLEAVSDGSCVFVDFPGCNHCIEMCYLVINIFSFLYYRPHVSVSFALFALILTSNPTTSTHVIHC